MDLSTRYLGLSLRTPLVPSASPVSKEIDDIKRLEDAGAAAIVLHSLFLEELLLEQFEIQHHLAAGSESFAESLTYFPNPRTLLLGPEEYLAHVAKAKKAVGIPIIASLNGASSASWTETARSIEQAGADAIELNLYSVPTDTAKSAAQIEQECLDTVKAVKGAVGVPVAVKISPFFSNMAHFAKRLDDSGADALVLFNRFYQPDIDLEAIEVKSSLTLSTSADSRLAMRWIAILHSRLRADLAATGGIHSSADALKAVLVGASVTMLCSVLLLHGFGAIGEIERGMTEWMETREYESLTQMRGSMTQSRCANPSAFERAQYVRALKGYKPAEAGTAGAAG